MERPDKMVDATPTPPRRLRFNLRTLFVVVTVAAIAFAACRAFPETALICAAILVVVVAFTIALAVPFVCLFAVAFVIETILVTTSRFAHWLWYFDPWATPRLPPEQEK